MTTEQAKKRAVQLAEEHVKFLLDWTEYVFVESFIHGYKHGQEDREGKQGAHRSDTYTTAKTPSISSSDEQMYDGKISSPKYP